MSASGASSKATWKPAWAVGYRPSWLRGDIIAALTVWAVLIPESLAYATIAGVPPEMGLYAAVPSLIIYGLIGSSRVLIVGPMSATAALSASIIALQAGGDADLYIQLSIGLSIVTGVLAILAGVLRLGFLASFISEPVLKGFIVGLALTIIAGQIPGLLGVEKPEGAFFEKIWGTVQELGSIDGLTITVGAIALAILLAFKKWLPTLPAALIVALGGIFVVRLMSLEEQGLEVVGTIPAGLPGLGAPEVTLSQYGQLIAPAVGLMLIGFVEGLAAAKVYADRDGYRINANRELMGLGGANLGSGFFGGMVVNGSLSKTAVNGSAGGRTPLASIFVGVLTILTLLFLTGLFESLPEAVLSAIVIGAVIELVDFTFLKRLYKVWSAPLERIYRAAARVDFIGATAALIGVLLFDTLPGLLIGVVISLVLLIYRASRPYMAHLGALADQHQIWVDVSRHEDAVEDKNVAVLRVEAGLFFANSDYVRDAINEAAQGEASAVVLDVESVPYVDATGAATLVRVHRELADIGVPFVLARVRGQVRDVVTRVEADVAIDLTTRSVAGAVAEATRLIGASSPPEGGTE
ncbi:SulP family inorganic anion transporter [Demequina sediminicola]|uniref:SulP family inorganic anion transporter n=1 Tax=Demequina sediminicola TaxID=1095026 RepID=UPI000784D3BF|nr:SulP family inorganic anion transporter [Demequina sediminicola]